MSDNPFLEPDDSERTIIRPTPGGRRLAASGAQPTAAVPSALRPAQPVARAPTAEPAAAPPLQLMARLPNTINPPDPGELRERAVRAMHTFEQRVRDLDLPRELLPPAHYALCASIDDVVLNTPWGSTGVWDANSLVSI